MKKCKINGILIFLIICILPLVINPISKGDLVSLWGPSQGSIRTYTHNTTYNGSIENTIDYGNYIFSIINIWDNDDNDYEELLYSRERTIEGDADMDLHILDDSALLWSFNNMIIIILLGEIYPLLPIGYNNTDNVGMDWNAEIQHINSSLENYSVTIEGNVVIIHHWDFQEELLTGIPFEMHEYIKWDKNTGWLISYEKITKYGAPANYDSNELIKVKFGRGGLSLDLSFLMGIIGIITGGVGIVFGVLAYRKSKR